MIPNTGRNETAKHKTRYDSAIIQQTKNQSSAKNYQEKLKFEAAYQRPAR